MTRKAAASVPAAVVAFSEAREGVVAAEQALRDVEREGREARHAVIDARDEQHHAVYAAAKAGGRADVSEIRALVAAREQDAADMEVVVVAHTDAVTDARRALRAVILEHAPELLDLQEQHASEAEQARGEMERRHAAERAEQAAREQGVRAEATTVLDEMPNVFRQAMRGDELVPVIRPDRACPDLAPFLPEPGMPDYLQRAIRESRQLYRHEAESQDDLRLGAESTDDRLESLEQGEQARRAEMVTEAAQRAGWHDPDAAAKVLDLSAIAIPQGAAAAVKSYSAQSSYMVQQPLTQQDSERQWGAEILAGLERGGRS
jgi:hypothetical protein